MLGYQTFASNTFASGTQEGFDNGGGEGTTMNETYNDVRYRKLVVITGRTGSINDLINENTYWRALAGGSGLPLNDVKKLVLRGLGYTGSLNDMEKKYWEEV